MYAPNPPLPRLSTSTIISLAERERESQTPHQTTNFVSASTTVWLLPTLPLQFTHKNSIATSMRGEVSRLLVLGCIVSNGTNDKPRRERATDLGMWTARGGGFLSAKELFKVSSFFLPHVPPPRYSEVAACVSKDVPRPGPSPCRALPRSCCERWCMLTDGDAGAGGIGGWPEGVKRK